MTNDEYRASRFYQEWARQQGWVDAGSIVLDRSPTSCTSFVVPRHETRGLVDDAMTARLALIGPHIRRAFQVGKLTALRQAEVATFVDAFDGLGAGVFLVDAGARIVHANIAGRAMLGGEGPLLSMRGRLVARDSIIDRTLRAALAALGGGGSEVGRGSDALALFAEDGEAYVAHLLPLAPEAGPRAGVGRAVVAAVFVHKAGMDRPSLPESVARHFSLTPTELKVLLGIVEMGGAPEVADALGIGDNTVKTHLGRLYQKTGTRRQADLVKLVAGYSTPFVG
jgi:DNA-binding CsgD family transcriptional regulator